MTRRRAELLLLLLAATAAVAVLWSRVLAVQTLSVDAYRDDAYYYFDFVRNWCTGRGPVVGDARPTNGVQFAWAVLLAPLYLLGGDVVLEQGARWLGLGLLGAAGLVLACSFHKDGLPRALAALGGLAVIANPFLVTEAQNGQESGLVALMVAVAIRWRSARWPWFAVVCACATLARAELWFLCCALAFCRTGTIASRVTGPAIALCAYAITNLALAGHLTPDAAWPMPWLMRETFLLSEPGLAEWLRQLWWFGRPVLLGSPFVEAGMLGSAALVALAAPAASTARATRGIALAVFALLGLLTLCGIDEPLVPASACVLIALSPLRSPELVRLARWLLAAALAIVALHELVRWYPREYYWTPLAMLGAWATLRFAAGLPHRLARLALAVALALLAVRASEAPRRFPWQATMLLAAEHVREFVPAAARVGAFNAGLLAWHSGRRVVNLDGVVNAGALAALRAHELGAYLTRERIDWLCDHPVQIERSSALHACGRYFGADFEPSRELVEVARFVVAGVDAGRPGTAAVVLWRLASAGGRASPAPVQASFQDLGPDRRGGRLVRWTAPFGSTLWLDAGQGERVAIAVGLAGSQQFLALSAPSPGTTARLYDSPGDSPIMSYR